MNNSSRNDGSHDIPDSGVLQENSWFKSLSKMDDFQNIFGSLTGVQLCTTTSTDNDQSNGSVRKREETDIETSELKRKEDVWSKRTRSAKQHNMSEKKRRDRINQSLKTLQELIPNCHKSDSVSVLDDAIKYLKALKFQVQIMSAGGGGAMFQAPYISPSGIQSTQQAQQFSPSLSRFSSSCCPPVILSPCFNPSPSRTLGLSLMPVHGNYAVPQIQMPSVTQFQMPSIHSQQLPGPIDPSAMAQNFTTRFSPGFNFSSQEGYFPHSK